MKINESVCKNAANLPGYSLVGYTEIAIPVHEIKLCALILTHNTIPVIEEFVLNLYSEGLSRIEIQKVLGIEVNLINKAWSGLMSRDYIGIIDQRITRHGVDYLKNNSVEELEKIEFSILIDGITGQIKKIRNQLMTGSNSRKIGIKSIRPNNTLLSIDKIDFASVKKIYKEYKKEFSDLYYGSLLELIDISSQKMRYRRVSLLILKNSNNHDTRILAYDGYNKLDEYEEKLKILDNNGEEFLKYQYGNYFEDAFIHTVNDAIENNKNDYTEIPIDKYNLVLDDYINNSNNILISSPLVSMNDFNNGFVVELKKAIKNNKKVKLLISGDEFSNETQKNNYFNLWKFKMTDGSLSISQTPNYVNKIIFDIDKKYALVTVYEKSNTGLQKSCIGITERIYQCKGNLFDILYNSCTSLYNVENINKYNISICNRQWLSRKISSIISLTTSANERMMMHGDIGWVGSSEIPNISQLSSLPLALDDTKFEIFIKNMNKSFVESLDGNAKSNHLKNYFWEDFKNRYPNLQHILDKIRTYRNKSEHLKLDSINKIKYSEYLNEDLNGHMPDFLNNGYLILQCKLINELEDAIKNVLNCLK